MTLVELSPTDLSVRAKTYQLIVKNGRVPKIADLAEALSLKTGDVADALRRLREARMIVLMPESGEILMAEPWSAVPTPFTIECDGRNWWGNCIWDALGIAAALRARGQVTTSCSCCGEAMTAEVEGERILSGEGVVHFAVPAKQWWDDIHFT